MTDKLDATKRGVAIECVRCGYMKKPVGRSGPLGASFCTQDECDGYNTPPRVGSLWPGETEADFGYPVGVVGTNKEQA